jgi:dTDP-4-amino-4,6-dideoxygalactose transaminase
MPRFRDAVALGKGQARNLRQLLLGRPLRPTSFVSMTLDADDAQLAARWLEDRAPWDSNEAVELYEHEFARWIGCEHAYGFMSGRESLSACLFALDIGAGDEVIVPAYTCIVVANSVQFSGASVVWADIELDTYGLDVEDLAARITPRTRAIILQHLYGLVCRDYEAILALAAERGLKVIEDCAHSTGAEFRGRRVGVRGDAAFFSSEHSKAFSTIMGGVAIARVAKTAERLALFAQTAPGASAACVEAQLHAVIAEYQRYKDPQRWWRAELARARQPEEPSHLSRQEQRGERPSAYGRRIAPAVAALGSNQLRKLDTYNERRRATAVRWDVWCEQRGYARATVVKESRPIFLRYPVLVEPERKRQLSWGYREFGIKPGVWFTSHTHPIPTAIEGVPRAAEAVERCINLPCLLS